MVKIFNNEIIKFLFVKNLDKARNHQVDPGLNKRVARLRSGESYVVFLDRQHRKELQQQINDVEESRLVKRNGGMGDAIHGPSMQHPDTVGADDLNEWMRTQVHTKQPKMGLKTRLSKSLFSIANVVKKSFNGLRFISTAIPVHKKEGVRITPAIIGAFIDEPLCATIDQMLYAICYTFGWRLTPYESPSMDD